MARAADDVFHDYLLVLERVIVELRTRIRQDDAVKIAEAHDLMDAVHNIPEMLRNCEGWHVPENIDADLARYDSKWLDVGDKAERRRSLIQHLHRARDGDYDPEPPNDTDR